MVGVAAPQGELKALLQQFAVPRTEAAPQMAASETPSWTPTFAKGTTQNYEALASYWPASVLSTVNKPQTMRLQAFIDMAIMLGCRHPSEQTVRVIVASYLMANQAEPCVQQLTMMQRHSLVGVVKDGIRAAARKDKSSESLLVLPDQPKDLRDHPQTEHLFKKAYEHEGPVTLASSAGDLKLLMDTIPLRMPRHIKFQNQGFGANMGGPSMANMMGAMQNNPMLMALAMGQMGMMGNRTMMPTQRSRSAIGLTLSPPSSAHASAPLGCPSELCLALTDGQHGGARQGAETKPSAEPAGEEPAEPAGEELVAEVGPAAEEPRAARRSPAEAAQALLDAVGGREKSAKGAKAKKKAKSEGKKAAKETKAKEAKSKDTSKAKAPDMPKGKEQVFYKGCVLNLQKNKWRIFWPAPIGKERSRAFGPTVTKLQAWHNALSLVDAEPPSKKAKTE